MALFRRSRPDPDLDGAPDVSADPLTAVDRAAVPVRLVAVVDQAMACARRYRSLVEVRPDGPLRDRIAEIGGRVDAGVLAVYETALRARRLDDVALTLDPSAVTAAYKDARRRDASPELVESHRVRFESVQRILNARDEIDGRLELLEARLEATVARVAELALEPAADLDAVEADLAEVTGELTALRAGLDELA